MSARFLTHRAGSGPLSGCQDLFSLSKQAAHPNTPRKDWGASIRHPRGAARSFTAAILP